MIDTFTVLHDDNELTFKLEKLFVCYDEWNLLTNYLFVEELQNLNLIYF